MIVALDIGLKRIGVAVCFDNKTILPSEPILRKNRNQAAKEVSQMLREKNAKILVVGIPMGLSSQNEMKSRIEHFCSLLNTDLEPVFVDESFTSIEASSLISSKNSKNGKLDSLAACEILRRYLA